MRREGGHNHPPFTSFWIGLGMQIKSMPKHWYGIMAEKGGRKDVCKQGRGNALPALVPKGKDCPRACLLSRWAYPLPPLCATSLRSASALQLSCPIHEFTRE